ncbi:hypothetical protein TNCV_3332401 [Trichonephila clavipes]|nr:hypothetical protein TNCV_3332401 [Trichonephila clavipes]
MEIVTGEFMGAWRMTLRSPRCHSRPGTTQNYRAGVQLVVKVTVSWLVCHKFEPSVVEDPPGGEDRYTLILSRLKPGVWLPPYQPTATAGSDVVQSGRPIFEDFFQHLWPYIGNITANVVFHMVKRLWLIRIDQ